MPSFPRERIMRRYCFIFLLLLTAAMISPVAAFPLTVDVTGEEDVNLCEADTYYISIENPAWQSETAENIVITNTMPPDGFVFQDDSAIITAPAGSLSGNAADPSIAGNDLTWDLDTLFGSDIYLTPGQSLDIEFKMEIDCAGSSGQNDTVVVYDFPSPSQQSDTGSLFVTVYPGDINVIKSPVTQEASRGEWMTYTLKIESSGLGKIRNVEVRDTLGAGLQFVDSDPAPGSSVGSTYYWTAADLPGLAEMDPDTAEWITLTALVVSCSNLDNNLNASFGCEGMVSVPDTVCLDTATEVPAGTATATIDYQLKPPDLSFDLSPSMSPIDYCTQTNITVAVTNGDPVSPDPQVGCACNLVFDTNLDTTGYQISNVVGAGYAGGDFTVGTVPANDTVYFTYDINWPDGSCPPDPSSQNTLWLPEYDDQCGNPFAPPVDIFPVSMTGMPSLSISKNNPGTVNGNDTITFSVQVDYSGPDGFTPTITDDYPNPSPGWSIQSISDGGTDDGNEITWSGLTFNDGDSRTVTFQMTAPGGDPCAGPDPGLYTNSATVTGGTDCRGCTISSDSTSQTFAVEDTPGCDSDDCISSAVLSGGGTAEVCTTLSYTATYTFGTGDDLPSDWSAATFTSQMPLNVSLSSLDSVEVDGFNYQTYVTDNGGAGGTYIVDLSGLDFSPAPAPDAASTLEVSFTFDVDDTVGSSYQRTDLALGGGCGTETNWFQITIERSLVSVGVSGLQIVDHCGRETYTLSLSKNGYIAYDLLAVFDLDPDGNGTDNYYYCAGSTVFTGTFTETGWGNLTAFEPDISTPGELRWNFQSVGGGSGDLSSVGDIEIDLLIPCAADIFTYAGEAQYNDRCDDGTIPRESTATDGPDQPLWVREGDISMIKMPESYYATEERAIWSLTVINGGDGGAYNLEVFDTLSSDLSYYYAVPQPESVAGKNITWNFQSLTSTWDDLTDLDGGGFYNDLIPGGTVGLTLEASIDACDDLSNRVYSQWGCCTEACQTSNWATSTVFIPPPGVLGVPPFRWRSISARPPRSSSRSRTAARPISTISAPVRRCRWAPTTSPAPPNIATTTVPAGPRLPIPPTPITGPLIPIPINGQPRPISPNSPICPSGLGLISSSRLKPTAIFPQVTAFSNPPPVLLPPARNISPAGRQRPPLISTTWTSRSSRWGGTRRGIRAERFRPIR